MKKTIKTFTEARNSASTGERIAQPRGSISRIAAAAGHAAGNSLFKVVQAEQQALELSMQKRHENAISEAKGVMVDVGNTIVAIREGISSPATPYWSSGEIYNKGKKNEVTYRNWVATAQTRGDTSQHESPGYISKMIAPATFEFGGEKIKVETINLNMRHLKGEGTSGTIFLNAHNGEELPYPYPPHSDMTTFPPEPVPVFGSQFRIDINEEGQLDLMRSNNLFSGFSESNRVSFEDLTQATQSIQNMLGQVRQFVHEQSAFDSMTAQTE